MTEKKNEKSHYKLICRKKISWNLFHFFLLFIFNFNQTQHTNNLFQNKQNCLDAQKCPQIIGHVDEYINSWQKTNHC